MTVYADTICVTYEFDNYFQNSSSTTAAQFLDVPMKFSRSMATITYVVSVPAAIAILFLACVEMGRCGFYTLGGICIFQGVVAILSLVSFQKAWLFYLFSPLIYFIRWCWLQNFALEPRPAPLVERA